MAASIHKTVKCVNTYRYEIIGFIVLLFLYNRTHLPIMTDFPKLCDIENFISKVSYFSIDAFLFVIAVSACFYIRENSLKNYFLVVLRKFSIPALFCACAVFYCKAGIDIIWLYLTVFLILLVFIPIFTISFRNKAYSMALILSALFLILDIIAVIMLTHFMTSIIIAYIQLFVERLFIVILGISLCMPDKIALECNENFENKLPSRKLCALIMPAAAFIIGFIFSIKAYNEGLLLLSTRYIQMAISVLFAISVSELAALGFSISYKCNGILKRIYGFFGRACLYFLACTLIVRMKNPALTVPETAWNNHVKNIITFGKSIVAAAIVYLLVSFVTSLIATRGGILKAKNSRILKSVIVTAGKLYAGVIGCFHMKPALNKEKGRGNSRYIIFFISIIISFFIVFAFTYTGKVAEWIVYKPLTDRDEIFDLTKDSSFLKFLCGLISISGKNTETGFILFIFILIVIYNLLKKSNMVKPSIACGLCCIIFGVNQVFGISMVDNFNCDAVVGNQYQVIISVICMVGFSMLAFFAYFFVKHVVLPWIINNNVEKDYDVNGFRLLWKNHQYACSVVFISLGYIPYIAACFPGIANYDVVYAIDSFFSEKPSMHHPILTTWFYSYVFKWGQALGNISMAGFIIVLIQAVMAVTVFSSVVIYLKKCGCNNIFCICVMCYYALTPIFAQFICEIIKDTLFASFFTLFILKMADIVIGCNTGRKDILKLMLAALATCLFRYNGFYVIIPTLTILGVCLLKKKTGITILIATFVVVLLYKGIDRYAVYQLNYEAKTKTDTISALLQCTANYVNKYPDEITEEERDCIDNIVDWEHLQYYLGYVSDPVKSGCTFLYPTEDDYKAYYRCCRNMFLKHPLAFVEAIYANSCGYYTVHGNDMYILHVAYSTNNLYKGWLDELLDSPIEYDNPIGRWACYYIAVLSERLPVIGIHASPGIYTWLLFVMFCIILKYVHTCKKSKNAYDIRLLTIFIPYFLMIASCCLSPVNNLMRYYLGVMEAFPIIIGFYAGIQKGSLDNA